MRNKWNQRVLVLAAAALMLTAGTTVDRAMAYFTTYVTAKGGRELELGFTTTTPGEVVSAGKKQVTVQNTGEKDCYVRVKAFAGSQCELSYVDQSGGKWQKREDGDGYYYWTEILPENAGTGVLDIGINYKVETADSFKVIVVQEYIPVPYNKDGKVVPWNEADWNNRADVVKTQED